MEITLIGQVFDITSGQGVYRYSAELYKNLGNFNLRVKKIEIGTSKNPFKTVFKNIITPSFKLLKVKSDIYHFLMPELSFSCFWKRPSIVTIYDIIPLILKNERKKIFNLFFRVMLTFAKRADHIIVISKSTENDLINYLGIPKEKISLIYLGVDHNLFFPTKKEKNRDFTIGFLGGLSKRKNARVVLDVAEILRDEKIKFKIGGLGGKLEELKRIKEDKKLNNIDFVGFVPEKELNQFYNSLDLFIAPTIYDGFCMPGLESMACGCPIITSNTGALPEVAGDAGITVNPIDAEEIAKSILKIKDNPNLIRNMRVKSINHAKKFTWEKCINETIDIYKKFAKKVDQK